MSIPPKNPHDILEEAAQMILDLNFEQIRGTMTQEEIDKAKHDIRTKLELARIMEEALPPEWKGLNKKQWQEKLNDPKAGTDSSFTGGVATVVCLCIFGASAILATM